MSRTWEQIGVGLLFVWLLGAAGMAVAAGAEPETLWRRAQAAYEDGLLDQAETFFRQALEHAREDRIRVECVLGLARTLHRKGRHQEQIRLLQEHRAAAVTPGAERAFAYWEAIGQYALGYYEEALATLSRPIDSSPPCAETVRLHMRVLVRRGRADEAVRMSDAFLAAHPDHSAAAAVRLDAAGLLIESAPEQALGRLQELLQAHPKASETAQARWWQSLLLAERGRWTEARALLEILIHDDMAPGDLRAEACFLLAERDGHEGDAHAALALVEAGLERASAARWVIKGQLMRARLLVQVGRIEEGLSLLRRWVAVDPQHAEAPRAQLDTAWLLLEKDQHAPAAEAFQHYLDAYSDQADAGRAWLGQSWAFLEMGAVRDAAEGFQRAYRLLEDTAMRREALLKAADALFKAGDWDAARGLYEQFVETFPEAPETPRALFQTAQAFTQREELGKALAVLEVLRAAYPEDVFAERAWYQSGALRKQKGAWEQALEAFTAQQEAFPDGALWARAQLGKGLVQYRLHRFEEALSLFDHMPEEAGEWTEQALFMRIWCLYMLGRDADALDGGRVFLDRYAASVWAPHVLFWIGEYWHNQGNPAAAEQRFSELSTRFPSGALADEALYWAGRSAALQQEHARAIEYYEKLVQQYPDSPRAADARFMQGDALSEMGRFSAAILAFDDVIRHYADTYRADLARGRRGDCQFTLASEDPRRYEEALASYESLLQRPEVPSSLRWQARYKAGRCLEKMDRTDEALTHYSTILYSFLEERGPHEAEGAVWFSRAAFAAAAIQESRGRWREALAIYRRVKDARVPASAEAQQRSQRIRLEQWLRLEG